MKSHAKPAAYVRLAKEADAAAITQINIAAWRAAYCDVMPTDFLASLSYEDKLNNWHRALTNPGKGRYLVCERNEEVCGFAVFGPARDENPASDGCSGELVAINVKPDCWSQGIGKALLHHVIDEAQATQWTMLYLWVIHSNARARGLYEAFGFECEGKSKYNDTLCNRPLQEVRYAKRL